MKDPGDIIEGFLKLPCGRLTLRSSGPGYKTPLAIRIYFNRYSDDERSSVDQTWQRSVSESHTGYRFGRTLPLAELTFLVASEKFSAS